MKKLKFIIFKILIIVFNFAGISVSKRSVHGNILQQSRGMFAHLKATFIANNELVDGATGIVFSKDRAYQLFGLLYSYISLCEDPVPLCIIYTASTEEHRVAYHDLSLFFKKYSYLINFIEENLSFKSTLNNVIGKIKTRNIFFIVDDNVVIAPFDGKILGLVNTENFILSLRMSPHCKISYTTRSFHGTPEFNKSSLYSDLLEFNWFHKSNEWSDPYSLDGHVFALADIAILAKIGQYQGPNSFENVLKAHALYTDTKIGLCFPISKILNLPVNKVQKENSNHFGHASSEQLLALWMGGKAPNTIELVGHIPKSPHEEHYLTPVDINYLLEKLN